MASKVLGTTTSMMLVLFGTNALLWMFFQWIARQEKKPDPDDDLGASAKKEHKNKKLSKPFTLTLDGFTALTHDMLKLGFIMAVTYICEYHWIFDHSGKEYNRDLFMFICAIFFLYGFYTLEPTKDLSLLSRDQTEEWKGWMQFIFLLYHYFHAEEVYNSVRIMITCYVWMTGFGNFSFFYIKQDFGWLRVVQMLWRLNFAVLFLMWTHGNTYILYYICPLHTFYFLLVYATMAIYSQINHTQWGIRAKLMVVGVLIFIIWDLNSSFFDLLFGTVLGRDKIIGAKQGSLWEYYFRTSLDHYSSFLGMIFALNFPLAEQYYMKANGTWAPVITGSILAAISVYWYTYIYTLEKLQYNLCHSYWAIVPLITYIFFRNITPGIRSKVSMSMHALGKTTLETYLLQHHVWLTSNAKTLLTIVPDSPYMNFFFATILFYLLSKELYQLTMSLRGMILPDDAGIAWVNMLGMFAVILVCGVLAFLMHAVQMASLFFAFLCSCVLFVGVLHAIKRYCPQINELASFSKWFTKTTQASYIAMVVFLVLHFMAMLMYSAPGNSSDGAGARRGLHSDAAGAANDLHRYAISASDSPDVHSACFSNIAKGHWSSTPCDVATAADVGARRLWQQAGNDSENSGFATAGAEQIASRKSVFDASGLSFSRIFYSAEDANLINGRVMADFDASDASAAQRRTGDTELIHNAVGSATNAYCQTNNWHWTPDIASKCDYRGYNSDEALSMFQGKRVVFVGDSMLRATYHAFNQLLDREYTQLGEVAKLQTEAASKNGNGPVDVKHTDFKHVHVGSHTTVEFFWAPQLQDISNSWNRINSSGAEYGRVDVAVMGVAAWDALHGRDVTAFARNLENMKFPLHEAATAPVFTVWLLPTTIIDSRLNTADKRTHLTESKISAYRAAVKKSENIRSHVDVFIDPSESVSSPKHSSGPIDGVHYSDDVYAVIGQLCVNGYSLSRRTIATDGTGSSRAAAGEKSKISVVKPKEKETKADSEAASKSTSSVSTTTTKPASYKPKPTGSMSFPVRGFALLVLAAVMLITKDNYLGMGYVGLLLSGRAYDYDEAYTPLLRSINRNVSGAREGSEGAGAGEAAGSSSSSNEKASASASGTSSASSSSSEAGEGDLEMDSLITKTEEGLGGGSSNKKTKTSASSSGVSD